MGLSSILSVIHTVTTDPMLNFKCGINGHGLKERYAQADFNSLFSMSIMWTEQKLLFNNWRRTSSVHEP